MPVSLPVCSVFLTSTADAVGCVAPERPPSRQNGFPIGKKTVVDQFRAEFVAGVQLSSEKPETSVAGVLCQAPAVVSRDVAQIPLKTAESVPIRN
jgi:hypothetical protein